MSAQVPIHGRSGVVGHALVDDADADLVNQHRWNLNTDGYAKAAFRVRPNVQRGLAMHRLLMGLEHGDPRTVDHINRDKLDNRRANLRICARGENSQNHPGFARTSIYRGVSLHGDTGKWQATVVINHKRTYLGLFTDELEAARTAARFRSQHMTHSVEDTELIGEVA